MSSPAFVDDGARDSLVRAILDFLSGEDLLALRDVRRALEQEIDAAGSGALLALRARLTAGDTATYEPRDPLAQRIHHLLADRLLLPDSTLIDGHHLAGIAGRSVIVFANHLSYSDANLLEILLHRAGEDRLADRLTAIAGPKVFTSRTRRFSSLCFGTIKTAQSADVASEEAVVSAREIARAAKQAIETARERLRAGDAILLFGEGSRSRTGSMQRMLPAVSRYVDADAWVLPVGLTGTETFFPVADSRLHRVRVTARVGRPFAARALIDATRGDRALMVDAIGVAVAALLPPASRGVYGGDDLGAARAVAGAL
jgi:1-acyl-sn-glycerol-3-phosphate acyltransferase